MGGLYRILFERLKEPLGLPINIVDEYIILLIVETVAYVIAYKKTGIWGRDLNSGERSIIHWTIRTLIFIGIWAILRGLIALYYFVMNNKMVSLIIASVTIIVLAGIIGFIKYKSQNKVQVEAPYFEDDD